MKMVPTLGPSLLLKLVHYTVCIVGKQTVGIRLKCLFVIYLFR